MLCRLSQVVQRNVEHHRKKHRPVLHHKRKVLRAWLVVLSASTTRLQAYSQQNVQLIYHAETLVGPQVWTFMASIRRVVETAML